jgi:HAE1 family hydrophobic/amphiphilic exporter-1
MKLPQLSVRRPVFTTMVTLIVLVLGTVSLTRLKIDLLPNIELPTLTIRTEYEGASPVVMERLVTQIIEEIVGTVPGVEELASQSSEGSSSVRVENAELRRDVAKLRTEVKDLREDPQAVERIAREQLGLVRKSEVVFQFDKR